MCLQRKTPDGGQKNCPKHVEFYSKNKFEKLVHLIGFILWTFPILEKKIKHIAPVCQIFIFFSTSTEILGFL